MRYQDMQALDDRPALRTTGLIIGLAIAVMLAAVALSISPSHATRPLAAGCESLDATASERLSRLLGETSAAAESRARDAVFRLQRARKNCRLGLVTLAQRDYDAIGDGRAGRYNRYR
jgi:hypothetical protein